jgi:hypothetical protein
MKPLAPLALIGVLLLAAAGPLFPCCMVPATYKGTIKQSAQEAVLFHADGREELVLKINYKIIGKTLPDRFAWVITVPNKPDKYQVADKDLFKKVFAWAEPRVRVPSRSKGGAGDDSDSDDGGGLKIGKPVKVGPYTITPVQALGMKALGKLNDWLAKNRFPKEDPRHMAYFVKNKFTFLAVKFNPRKGHKTVERAGGVPPLHLSFKSKTPYYPLRFSSRQGVFDVNLYVLTKKPFDYKGSSDSLRRINWTQARRTRQNVKVRADNFPKVLKAVYQKSRFKKYDGYWYLNVIRVERVNQNNAIAKWTKDIFFKTRG